MGLGSGRMNDDGADSSTVEHLLKPPDPEVAALRFAMDQIGVSLGLETEPHRRSLPDVAAELMRLLQNPKADANAVDRVISRDPFVSGQLLSVANSAMYSPRTPLMSVRDAAVRVGMEAVRDLALMVITTSRMFRITGFERQSTVLCQRAVVTAVASRRIAQLLGANNDFTFLAGLLHDIGHLLILEEAANQGVLNKHVMRSSDLLQVVMERSAHYHQEAGAAACRAWKLPEAAAQATMYHHRYKHEGKHYLVANLVAAADLFADALGMGTPAVALDAAAAPLHDMGIKAEVLPPLLEEVRVLSASMGVPV